MNEKYHLMTVAYTDIEGKLYTYSKPYYNSTEDELYTLLSINKETAKCSMCHKFDEIYPFNDIYYSVDTIGAITNTVTNKVELHASVTCNINGINMIYYASITEKEFDFAIPVKVFPKSSIAGRIQPKLTRPRGQLAQYVSMLGLDLNDVLILKGFRISPVVDNSDYVTMINKISDKFKKIIFYVPDKKAQYHLLPWCTPEDIKRIAPDAKPKLSRKGLIDLHGVMPELRDFPNVYVLNNEFYNKSLFKDILLHRGKEYSLD